MLGRLPRPDTIARARVHVCAFRCARSTTSQELAKGPRLKRERQDLGGDETKKEGAGRCVTTAPRPPPALFRFCSVCGSWNPRRQTDLPCFPEADSQETTTAHQISATRSAWSDATTTTASRSQGRTAAPSPVFGHRLHRLLLLLLLQGKRLTLPLHVRRWRPGAKMSLFFWIKPSKW